MQESYKHLRNTYDLINLLGDMGGVASVIELLLGVFLLPISAHSFIIKAARKLFFAKITDKNFFAKGTNPDNQAALDEDMMNRLSAKDQKEYRKHIEPNIMLRDSICLYFSTTFGRLFCFNTCFRKRQKLEKLYDATLERYDEETNLIKIMRTQRNTKKLMNASLMNKEMQFQLAHCEQNLIDLESSDSDSFLDDVSSTEEEGPESSRALRSATADPNQIMKNMRKERKASRKITKGRAERKQAQVIL